MQSILVAYDGSPASDSALEDLRHAGLPKRVEATVLTVALTDEAEGPDEGHHLDDDETPVMPSPMTARAGRAVEAARRTAAAAVLRLRQQHPRWLVSSIVLAGDPADQIVRHANEFAFDLVVIGSHGRNIVERAVLGSVSQHVLATSPCSVRIGRNWHPFGHDALRIVLGYDGSPDARLALRAVRNRPWPRGSTVHVAGAIRPDTAMYPMDPMVFDVAMTEVFEEQHRRLRNGIAAAVRDLERSGVIATGETRVGNPSNILLDISRAWGADFVVVGAKGHDLLERTLIGSVSSSLAARCDCSVEVIRQRTPRT